MAVIEVGELTVKLVAAIKPNFTAVTATKLVPVIVTEVPPTVDPEVGLTAVTVGSVDLLDEGPEAVMSAATAPEVPAGLWGAVGCTALETLVS